MAEREEQCHAREIELMEKKFAKENEKLVEEGKPARVEDVLRSRLSAVEDEFSRLRKSAEWARRHSSATNPKRNSSRVSISEKRRSRRSSCRL